MSKSVLIVDDDPNIQDTAKDILEDAGYRVETAGTSAAALERLEKEPADLAIIDFNLPDGTGVELASKAKALYPKLVIFLLTGESHVELGPAKSAVQATLTKPVNPSQLIDILQRNS